LRRISHKQTCIGRGDGGDPGDGRGGGVASFGVFIIGRWNLADDEEGTFERVATASLPAGK